MLSSEASPAVVFIDVEINGVRSACRVVAGRIVGVGAHFCVRPGDRTVNGRGGALLPGLADHHLHLRATAAARASVDLDGALELDALVGSGPVSNNGWLRLIGAGRIFHLEELDVVWPKDPVRVLHRSGAVWMLNSSAIAQLASALDPLERCTGQLWRADERLRDAIRDAGGSVESDLAGLGSELARYGITHVTDATPDLDPASIAALKATLPQHLLALVPGGGGPVKLVVADHEPPDLDGLVARIKRHHESGQPVAIHAVTRVSLVITLAALATAGTVMGDRIEHAAVCDDVLADQIAALGVVVVTQPALWARRGLDFMAESPANEHPWLWHLAGLSRRGVQVALSSDAPYASPNPWDTIRAAATRILRDGTIGGPDERVSPAYALRSMMADPHDPTGPPRAVAPGMPADLVLFKQPLTNALNAVVNDQQNPVRLTMINGVIAPS